MRRLTLLLTMSLATVIAARADGIDLTNKYGTVTITNSGIVSVGSELMSFNGITAPPGHSLGTLSFSTGTLSSGNIWKGGTFSSVGSSFDIIGRGQYGQPKGMIFNGAFVGTIDWTLIASNRQFHEYELSGVIEGQLSNGRTVFGKTAQTIYTFWNQERVDNKGNIYQGITHMVVPESGTLLMMGTGLLTMVTLFRRRLSARRDVKT